VGLGRFRPGLFLPEDAPAQAREHPGKAHDQLVTVAAEAGVPAAVLLLVVLGLLGWRGVRTLPAGAALVGGVALLALLSALHDPLFHVEASLALMLMLGAGVGALDRLRPQPP
jgi:O-antigen ligase